MILFLVESVREHREFPNFQNLKDFHSRAIRNREVGRKLIKLEHLEQSQAAHEELELGQNALKWDLTWPLNPWLRENVVITDLTLIMTNWDHTPGSLYKRRSSSRNKIKK